MSGSTSRSTSMSEQIYRALSASQRGPALKLSFLFQHFALEVRKLVGVPPVFVQLRACLLHILCLCWCLIGLLFCCLFALWLCDRCVCCCLFARFCIVFLWKRLQRLQHCPFCCFSGLIKLWTILKTY